MTVEPPGTASDHGRLEALDVVRDLMSGPDPFPPDITHALQVLSGELRSTQQELDEASAKYRVLVEQIPAIVYIDVVGEAMSTSYVAPRSSRCSV